MTTHADTTTVNKGTFSITDNAVIIQGAQGLITIMRCPAGTRVWVAQDVLCNTLHEGDSCADVVMQVLYDLGMTAS